MCEIWFNFLINMEQSSQQETSGLPSAATHQNTMWILVTQMKFAKIFYITANSTDQRSICTNLSNHSTAHTEVMKISALEKSSYSSNISQQQLWRTDCCSGAMPSWMHGIGIKLWRSNGSCADWWWLWPWVWCRNKELGMWCTVIGRRGSVYPYWRSTQVNEIFN